MSVLRQFTRKVLAEMFQSHTVEPSEGDLVRNVNPGCKHFNSVGKVLSTQNLPDDTGKIIVYVVTNSGDNFSPGDVLKKTLDQLTPAGCGHKKEVSGCSACNKDSFLATKTYLS